MSKKNVTAANNALTQQRLMELLDYSPISGYFYKKGTKSPVGHKMENGFRRIHIDGRQYLSHRLAFLWMNGCFPEEYVDFKDQNRNNQARKNLREANAERRARHTRTQSGNSTRIKGVSRRGKRFVSTIRGQFIGSYETLIEATTARYNAEQNIQGWLDDDLHSPAKRYVERQAARRKTA